MDKILLVDIDSKFPNLALMKFSAFYKSQGHRVLLHRPPRRRLGGAFPLPLSMPNPDKVLISCVFTRTLEKAQRVRTAFGHRARLGGPALEQIEGNNLGAAEHVMPDYELYPDMDYSLGFTTRGCIRDCPWCFVRRNEGAFREYAPISEFHRPDHKKVKIWDNNFLAAEPESLEEKCNYLIDQKVKVTLDQGLDARLVTEEIAQLLSELRSYSSHFTRRYYYFSWDEVTLKEDNRLDPQSWAILGGLRRMMAAGVKPTYLTVYVLVGFNTSHYEDYYRFKALADMGMDPFIMVYNNRKDDDWLNHFARYVNWKVYTKVGLDEYSRLPDYLIPKTEEIMERYEKSQKEQPHTVIE